MEESTLQSSNFFPNVPPIPEINPLIFNSLAKFCKSAKFADLLHRHNSAFAYGKAQMLE